MRIENRKKLSRYAWLSILTALGVMALKVFAWAVTGSVGLLSDALESGVNLVAAIIALIALTFAAEPPDDQHTFGHSKAEYFSSGVEGTLILLAAVTIGISAVSRLLQPRPIDKLGEGIIISLVAALANLAVARILLVAGERNESVTLVASARHLMTDVWSSAAVVVGVSAVGFSGWLILDPLIALAVAAQILFAGAKIVRESVSGLMDSSLPQSELERLEAVLKRYSDNDGVHYHALRTRRAGAQRFVSVHLQVPGAWTVQRGHNLIEQVEAEIRSLYPMVSIIVHLEPVEDPASYQDIDLTRITSR